MAFKKEFFENVNFEKKSADNKLKINNKKIPVSRHLIKDLITKLKLRIVRKVLKIEEHLLKHIGPDELCYFCIHQLNPLLIRLFLDHEVIYYF